MTEQTIFLSALISPMPARRTAYRRSACAGDADLAPAGRSPARRPRTVRPVPGRAGRGTDWRPPGRRRARTPVTAEGDDRRRPRCRTFAFSHPPTRPGFARPIGPLRGAGSARPRRVRHRPAGVRRPPAPGGRDQGAGPATGDQRDGPGPVPPRGQVRRGRPRRARRPHLRGRRRGRAGPVPGHGVRRRADPPAEARPDRPAAGARDPADRPADRPRDWRRPTPRGSSTATSSRRTSCWRTGSSG